MLSDFPRIECPFMRKSYLVEQQSFKEYGRVLKLRSPEVYLVMNQINPTYSWVFDDKDTIAIEELDGTKLQSNPYQLDSHMWYPFAKAIKQLKYKSFHEHECTFENFSHWFGHHLKSLHHANRVGHEHAACVAGVIFYNLKRKKQGKTYLAKLRRDMFDWYYSDKLKILYES